MKLIVGLGNPGEKYEKTRHNLGFMVLDQFLKDNEPVSQTIWGYEEKLKSDTIEIAEKIILAKPKTYMNNSGLAVQLLTTNYKLLTTDLWVVHDDIDLPLGSMKIRFGGASAGHKGVTSIINSLGTDKFWRFRLGIGKPFKGKGERVKGRRLREKVDDYVLSSFLAGETHVARELIKKAVKALEIALGKGIETAQNRLSTG